MEFEGVLTIELQTIILMSSSNFSLVIAIKRKAKYKSRWASCCCFKFYKGYLQKSSEDLLPNKISETYIKRR
jgi:hypothetical protein